MGRIINRGGGMDIFRSNEVANVKYAPVRDPDPRQIAAGLELAKKVADGAVKAGHGIFSKFRQQFEIDESFRDALETDDMLQAGVDHALGKNPWPSEKSDKAKGDATAPVTGDPRQIAAAAMMGSVPGVGPVAAAGGTAAFNAAMAKPEQQDMNSAPPMSPEGDPAQAAPVDRAAAEVVVGKDLVTGKALTEDDIKKRKAFVQKNYAEGKRPNRRGIEALIQRGREIVYGDQDTRLGESKDFDLATRDLSPEEEETRALSAAARARLNADLAARDADPIGDSKLEGRDLTGLSYDTLLAIASRVSSPRDLQILMNAAEELDEVGPEGVMDLFSTRDHKARARAEIRNAFMLGQKLGAKGRTGAGDALTAAMRAEKVQSDIGKNTATVQKWDRELDLKETMLPLEVRKALAGIYNVDVRSLGELESILLNKDKLADTKQARKDQNDKQSLAQEIRGRHNSIAAARTYWIRHQEVSQNAVMELEVQSSADRNFVNEWKGKADSDQHLEEVRRTFPGGRAELKGKLNEANARLAKADQQIAGKRASANEALSKLNQLNAAYVDYSNVHSYDSLRKVDGARKGLFTDGSVIIGPGGGRQSQVEVNEDPDMGTDEAPAEMPKPKPGAPRSKGGRGPTKKDPPKKLPSLKELEGN